MQCWKCFRQLTAPLGKVGFRAECPHCGSPLHTCVGCRFYAVGKPNDCAVPGTEFVRDREAANFCDEFGPRSEPIAPVSEEAKNRARRLLGEDE